MCAWIRKWRQRRRYGFASLQRARHGWAKQDAWNVDTYAAKMLSEILTEFIEQQERSEVGTYPIEFENEDDPEGAWLDVVREMRDGFREWYEWQTDGWMEPAVEDTDLSCGEWIDLYRLRVERVEAKLRRSLDLFNRWFPYLWW